MEHIRTWRSGGYCLKLWDTHQSRYGKSILDYKFYCNGKLVFKGKDFGCPPQIPIGSNRCIGSLLTFLALQPGDTDAEYFESYTPRQLAFAQEHGEELWDLAQQLQHIDK